MKLEHVAVNVMDPLATAEWYQRNLGLKVVRKMDVPPFTHFLQDSGGVMMLEIYRNPPDGVPTYAEMDPLLLHLAFTSEDPGKDSARLSEAGAIVVTDEQMDDGSHLVMLRDPWGLCIQLCKRSAAFAAGADQDKHNG